jgi:large subunit ribosomal protein L46
MQKPKEFNIVASALLSRPPLLLPQLHPFEEQVQNYQEMIERHQYSRFPINLFFKKGSIGEKRWKQQHPREPKKTGSGILRPLPEEDSPEWILGGESDQQVIKARRHAPEPKMANKTAQEQEDELSDEEKRDLEQFAEEEELENAQTQLPEDINMDYHRLEREPQRTLYCLVKRSRVYHEQFGKAVRGWELMAAGAPGTDPDNNPEALHMV